MEFRARNSLKQKTISFFQFPQFFFQVFLSMFSADLRIKKELEW